MQAWRGVLIEPARQFNTRATRHERLRERATPEVFRQRGRGGWLAAEPQAVICQRPTTIACCFLLSLPVVGCATSRPPAGARHPEPG